MQIKLKLRVINGRHWFIRGLIKGSPAQVIHRRSPHLTPLAHFHTVHSPSLAALQHHHQTQPRKGNTCTSSELIFRCFETLNSKKTTLQDCWLIFRRLFHMYMRHTGLSNAHTFFHVQDSHTLITFHHMGKHPCKAIPLHSFLFIFKQLFVCNYSSEVCPSADTAF